MGTYIRPSSQKVSSVRTPMVTNEKEIEEELREKEIDVSALVFIRVLTGSPRELAAKVASVPGVEKVYELTGDIDMTAVVNAVDMEELSKIIFEIRSVHGISTTDTRTIIGILP